MLAAIASGYLIAALAPLLARAFRSATGPVLALVPVYLLAWLLQFAPDVAQGRAWRFAFPWGGPGGLEAVFSLDALALFFAAITLLLSMAALLASGGLTLAPPARGRLLLAMLSLMTSALGFVLADTPVLVMGFSVLATLSAFLLLTARRGAVARARRTPVLMALLTGDLTLIAALAGVFIGSGALGLSELNSHTLAGPVAMKVTAALLAAAGLARLIIIPADLRTERSGMMSEAAAAMSQAGAYVPLTLYMALRLAPVLDVAPEIRLVLGVAGAALLVTGAVAGLAARRLRTVLACLTLAFMAIVFIHLAAFGTRAVSASLLLVLTQAFGVGALLLTAQLVSRGDHWLRLDALAVSTRARPVVLALFAAAIVALSGLLPSLATLTLSQSLAAGVMPHLNPAEIGFTVMAHAIVLAFVALIARNILKVALPSAADDGRAAAAQVIAILLILVFLIVPGWYPLVLERLFVSAVVARSGAPVTLGPIWPQGIAIAFAVAAFAVGGLLVWFDSRVKRVLDWCTPVVPRRPERAWRAFLVRVTAGGSLIAALAGKIGYRPVAASLAAVVCLLFGWLAVIFITGPMPVIALNLMPIGALAICAAAAALIATVQPDPERLTAVLPMASLLAALTLLAEQVTDLAYLLVLILVIETAILLVLSAHKPEASARAARPRVTQTVRIALALLGGGGAALTGLAVSNLSLDPTNWTRFDQIELWASILVLALALGVVATDLGRRRARPAQ